MPGSGDLLELCPEKPVVGGRMLARTGGEVVLVAGAIPGERVRARIDRRQQGVLFATTVEVIEASPDRRDPGPDPACGGMTFAFVAYPRQCALKAAIVADALTRIGRLPQLEPVSLTPSPERAYRLRYRVHPGPEGLGFFREGTHELCDPSVTGQLAAESLACLESIATHAPSAALGRIAALECMENLSNTERVINMVTADRRPPDPVALSSIANVAGVTGVSWTLAGASRIVTAAGRAWVADPVEAFVETPAGDSARRPAGGVAVRRHAPSFFQANRFLAPVLARRVIALVSGGPALDLYAGVGLFAVCLAASGVPDVTAIEGDPVSAADLLANARPFAPRLRVASESVESFLHRYPTWADATVIVDPPRTGMSRAAIAALIGARAKRLVYVSCDVATLARDARRLVEAGYTLTHVEALDLFPNTPHVEALAVFDRQ
jgi:23S rRNA (uracil1939-C5)-methyltransferase